MTETERMVRKFSESRGLRDPDRYTAIIVQNFQFEDVTREELQPAPGAYNHDYNRWRNGFSDGEC